MLEHAALLDAGGILGPGQLEEHRRLDLLIQPDPQQIDVHGVPAHRVALEVLDHHRTASASLDFEVEHGAGIGQGEPQLSGLNLEGDRLIAAAVDHAGDLALAPQPTSTARP